MTLDEYEKQVAAAVEGGDVDWLAREALERVRVNVGLQRELAELRRPQPGPVSGDGMRLRVGRKVGRTLYLQGGKEPSDADRLVGMVDTPALAVLIVDAVNRDQAKGADGRHGSR